MRWWRAVHAGVVLTAPIGACAPKIDAGPVPVARAAAPVQVIPVVAEGGSTWLEARVFAGSAADPPGMDGLAALAARTLAAEGGLDVTVDREWVAFRKECADAACIASFAEALARPRFDAAEVERARAEAIAAAASPSGDAVFEALLFEAHPYGHPAWGRAGTLAALDVQDLRDFHGARYVRESITVGVAGGADDGSLARGLEALPGRMPPEMLIGRPLDEDGRRVAVLDADTDAGGAKVYAGAPWGLTRGDPDFAALYVAFDALDARDDGLHAAAEPPALRRQGHWAVWTDPVPDADAAAAVRRATDAIERFARDGITAAELADAVARLTAPAEAGDPAARLSAALDAATTGMPPARDVLAAALPDLTIEEVNATLTRRLRPEDLQILAVTGDGDALAAALATPGITVTPLATVFR